MPYVPHTHPTHQPGCFRCDLSQDEVRAAAADAARDIAFAEEVMPGYDHDDECADEIRYGGCCKHHCPTGQHATAHV